MREETKYSLSKLEQALERLKEGALSVKDDLDKDGVIQRFEFTFELLWKFLKLYLQEKGIQSYSPKGCLQVAFKMGLIENEETFLNMLDDRNTASHVYSKEESDRVFENIQARHVSQIANLIDKLKKAE